MLLVNESTIAPGGAAFVSASVMFQGGTNIQLGVKVTDADWHSMTITIQGSIDGTTWTALKQLTNATPYPAATIAQADGNGFYSLWGAPQGTLIRASILRPTGSSVSGVLVMLDGVSSI